MIAFVRDIVLAVLLVAGAQTGAAETVGQSATSSFSPFCTGALKQGGIVICKAGAGTVFHLAGQSQTVGNDNAAVFGLGRAAPDTITVRAVSPDGRNEQIELAIELREDPYRVLEGMDCDKVDARTESQKAHAARSWTRKQAAFALFNEGRGPLDGFRSPAVGRVSSPFGPTRKYVGVSAETGEACESTSVHRGYDIAAPVGTEIVAPASGTVILGDPDLYYEGGTVFLDHGHGLVSVFMHMSAVDVSDGDTVQVGERLGAVGNTGRTTGPHLHWGVKWRNPQSADRSGDFYIDPELLLDLLP